jgi:hypothetical protein
MDAEHASRDDGANWKAVEGVSELAPDLGAEALGDDLPESVERINGGDLVVSAEEEDLLGSRRKR